MGIKSIKNTKYNQFKNIVTTNIKKILKEGQEKICENHRYYKNIKINLVKKYVKTISIK